jgi:hypothetical protein
MFLNPFNSLNSPQAIPPKKDMKHLLFLTLVTFWFGPTSLFVIIILALLVYSPAKVLPFLKTYGIEIKEELLYLYKQYNEITSTEVSERNQVISSSLSPPPSSQQSPPHIGYLFLQKITDKLFPS